MTPTQPDTLADLLVNQAATLSALLDFQLFSTTALAESSLRHAASEHLKLSIKHIDSCVLLIRCLPDLPYESPSMLQQQRTL